MKAVATAWNQHYTRARSRLSCFDENLVRLVSTATIVPGAALDYGTGSGRHLPLLSGAGFNPLIATDCSARALRMVQERFALPGLTAIEPEELAGYPDGFFSLIVSWGVMHYNSSEEALRQVSLFHRLLVPGGLFLGTLRSSRDTHLAHNGDLPGVQAHYYSLEHSKQLLSAFADIAIGHIERTLLGDLSSVIAHWVFRARK